MRGFDVRFPHSRVSEPVTSLSDVASSDTESSDTATKAAAILYKCKKTSVL